jgi:hypothetical protein
LIFRPHVSPGQDPCVDWPAPESFHSAPRQLILDRPGPQDVASHDVLLEVAPGPLRRRRIAGSINEIEHAPHAGCPRRPHEVVGADARCAEARRIVVVRCRMLVMRVGVIVVCAARACLTVWVELEAVEAEDE